MRWLALVLIVLLLACESRVIVLRSPSTQTGTPSASGAPSPTASPAPTKVALRPVPTFTPATRLLSYERASDIPRIFLRFLLTDDGRMITEDASGELVQRKLTPSGAAAMVLQAIETGLFDRDASHSRVPVPGTTPPARGPTFLVLVVANGPREVRVSFEPTGQPDDELFQRSPTREKLTALARGYEDLSWVPASSWAESAKPYQAVFHRLFLQIQPNVAARAGTPDAETVWPFLTAVESVGDLVSGVGGTPWRCAVLVDEDARTLAGSLVRSGAVTRYGPGSRAATAELAWRGSGTMRMHIGPLLPHEPATCAGAPTPI